MIWGHFPLSACDIIPILLFLEAYILIYLTWQLHFSCILPNCNLDVNVKFIACFYPCLESHIVVTLSASSTHFGYNKYILHASTLCYVLRVISVEQNLPKSYCGGFFRPYLIYNVDHVYIKSEYSIESDFRKLRFN